VFLASQAGAVGTLQGRGRRPVSHGLVVRASALEYALKRALQTSLRVRQLCPEEATAYPQRHEVPHRCDEGAGGSGNEACGELRLAAASGLRAVERAKVREHLRGNPANNGEGHGRLSHAPRFSTECQPLGESATSCVVSATATWRTRRGQPARSLAGPYSQAPARTPLRSARRAVAIRLLAANDHPRRLDGSCTFQEL